jgi:tetratricopeptide (TPR) repeat protein
LIAGATRQAPVQLVVTLRPENDPIDDTWIALAEEPEVTRLTLKPLDAEDALKLAQGLTDPPGEEMIRACIARAEGNPLFLDQLLRHARDEGGATVPGSIQSIVQSKLDRLQMVDRTVLEAAAVIGQRFSLEDVSAIAGLGNLDATPLVDAALIRSIQQGYLFSHALIRDAVLRTILRDQLQALHLRAAERFKGVDLVLYAEHLAAAQSVDAGAAFLNAAKQALGRYRKELTLSLTERGLEQSPPVSVRVELLIKKGEMLRDLGRGREALLAYEQLLAMTSEPQDQCRAKIGMIATMRILDRMSDALKLLDETQQIATDAGLDLELSEVHYYRGSLFFPMGNLDGCLAEHTLSLEYAEKVGRPERRALALSGLGDAHYARGKMFTAHDVIGQCLDVSQEHQLVAVEAANRFMLATVKIYLNETTKALKEAKASSELAARVGAARAEIVSRLTTGWIYASMNEFVDAEREINRGLDLATELGAKRFEPFLEETLADVALSRGDNPLAENIAEGALAKLRELDAMSFIGPWVLSTAARATSVPNRRKALLEEGEMLLAKGCVGHNYYRFYKNAVEACLDAREWQEARRYCDCLEEYTTEEPNPWTDYFVSRGRAIADAAEGKGDIEQLQTLLLVGGDASLMASMTRLSAALEDIEIQS